MSVLIEAKIIESDVAHYLKDAVHFLRLNDDGSINEESAPVSDETKTEGEQGTTPEGEAETATGIPASEAPGHTETLPEADANPVTPSGE